jgi:cytochrome P450
VNAIIRRRRSELAEAPEEAPRDLLAALLSARDPETGEAMSEIEVKANILTFIAAGQETTANALTWVPCSCCRNRRNGGIGFWRRPRWSLTAAWTDWPTG